MHGCDGRVVVEIPIHAITVDVIDGVTGVRWHRLPAVRGVGFSGRDVEDLCFDYGLALIPSRAGGWKEGFMEKSGRVDGVGRT